MNGQRYYTYRESERRLAGIAGAGVRFFRARQPVARSRSARLAAPAAEGVRHGVEDLFLPSSALHLRPLPRRARALRLALEPILVEGDVDVVLAGHEHLYERLQPQRGISYFTSGAARIAPARRSGAVHGIRQGVRSRLHFMLMEVSGEL